MYYTRHKNLNIDFKIKYDRNTINNKTKTNAIYIKEGKMYSPQLNNWSLILDKMFNPEDYSMY